MYVCVFDCSFDMCAVSLCERALQSATVVEEPSCAVTQYPRYAKIINNTNIHEYMMSS